MNIGNSLTDIDWENYLALDASFHEEDHPRGGKENEGQFTAKAGEGAGEELKAGSAAPKGGASEAPPARGSKTAHLVAAPADRDVWPEHIKHLVIPPAWTEVKISGNPDADLMAIGKDKAGRDQYVYSQKFSKSQAALKFARIDSLRKDKPMIENQLGTMRKSEDRNTRDHADCAMLILKMGVRPGSDTDTKAQKKAYGATTLEGKHVVEENGQVFLRFVGKKGVPLNLAVEDKGLAASLAKRAKKAGEDGRLFGNVRDGSLLGFVNGELDHGGYKTKDFRTLLANDLAVGAMRGIKGPKDMKEYKTAVRTVALHVSQRLGNTPTVALQSYIHPGVFAPWQGAATVEAKKKGKRKKSKLKPGELSGAQKAWASRQAKMEAGNVGQPQATAA